MREIQQLLYDGQHLFCPAHPDQKLEGAVTQTEIGTVAIVCTVPIMPGSNVLCMKSAEWPSVEDMQLDLDQGEGLGAIQR